MGNEVFFRFRCVALEEEIRDLKIKLKEAREIIKCDLAYCDDDCICSDHTERACKFLEETEQ